MKMDTMNVSLTPQQSEYVRRTVDREFGNTSEFFRDLIRERMRREIEADLGFLESTTPGAPAGPSDQEIEEVLAVQRKVRKELKRAGRL
ncbi:MAG: type II toxin-antitoxin system ParD family antitoxin [Verrucomicrobia bacterium]|nr:type II toxin-antitoxin system ParD family antitoxin [Verrucomicrobiota bacterium]